MNDVTRLLNSIEHDGAEAGDLLPLVYEELRKLAAHKMSNEPPNQTLQPTALVHEAWIRLVDKNGQGQFKNRAHFFGAAAEAMRRILIDRARSKQAQRHGGGQQRLEIEQVDIAAEVKDDELLLLINEAFDKFAEQHKLNAELVKLRYFAGLTNAEAAEILGISVATAKRYWTFARAWLRAEINATKGDGRKPA